MKRARKYYKLAQPDGWDFWTGKTINYREGIGRDVTIKDLGKYVLCSSSVVHASRNPNDCFVGAEIPCSAYEVWGVPVIEDNQKAGFVTLRIKQEIVDLDRLFGWCYSEAIAPIHPFKITPPKIITDTHRNLLQNWASVWSSAGVSVWDSVGAVVGDSVWVSMWDSVGASVRNSVRASAEASVWGSAEAAVGAYTGSLFPNIKTWKYIKHKKGAYPYQAAVDLWRQGLVARYDRKTWRLYGGKNAKILFTLL